MKPIRYAVMLTAGLLAGLVGTGCEMMYDAGVTGMAPFVDLESREREEAAHRRRFQQERSPDALQWLLVNRIEAGVPLAEVNQILGSDGVRVSDDMRFKTNGGHYRRDDQIYKWGPTNNGKSLFFGFREGKLINFDPGEFANGPL